MWVSERERMSERERGKRGGAGRGGEREREEEREEKWIKREREKGRVQDMKSVNMSHVSFVPYISINSDYTLPAFKLPRL